MITVNGIQPRAARLGPQLQRRKPVLGKLNLGNEESPGF